MEIALGRKELEVRRGGYVLDDLGGGEVVFAGWEGDEPDEPDDDDLGEWDDDYDELEGDLDFDDEDELEGESYVDDDGDELGRSRRPRRPGGLRRRPRSRLRRPRGRGRRRPSSRRRPRSRRPATRSRPPQRRAEAEPWVGTVVSGRAQLGAAGAYTISIRPQHPFRAKDVTFTGPDPSVDTVTSVFFADRQVFSDPNGVPMSIFAAQGFLRDLMEGQSLRAGLDITVQGVLSTSGTAGAHFTGFKPADSAC